MLKKLQLKPGMNQENTRYTNENGWWIGDKVRFRQGTPEKIGGWSRISANTFLGTCRSLLSWVAQGVSKLTAVGTNLKYYIENGGAYYDITPIRATETLTNPFTTSIGLPTVTVTDAAHACNTGDFVTFSGASAVGGLTISGEYQVTVLSASTYTITAASNASSSATGGGTVTAAYQLNTGSAIEVPLEGWGVGAWGAGTWGVGAGDSSSSALRTWSQSSYGSDLVFAYNRGPLCYWAFDNTYSTRGVLVQNMAGANEVPLYAGLVLVSDISRFVLVFGTNELYDTLYDPLLIRWSDQENVTNWLPSAVNQAGSIRLSSGSQIVSRIQTRQEVLVWTDTALYAMQYIGPPYVWSTTLMADNVTILGPNVTVTAAGVTYWMGDGKFYKYDGRVQAMRCDLRQYIFQDINNNQYLQCFGGSNEAFNEVWWFYPSQNSTVPDKYVIYNYLEDLWYTGNMTRYAWIDRNAVQDYPLAAIADKLVVHEYGIDDNSTAAPAPIPAYVESAEFDIDDGDKFGFVWRLLPDITFRGSTATNPSTVFTLYPMTNSGTGYGTSVGGERFAGVTRTVSVPVEEFTGQVYIRVRGRQMVIKVESSDLGVTWQLGSPRIDIKPDGRR